MAKINKNVNIIVFETYIEYYVYNWFLNQNIFYLLPTKIFKTNRTSQSTTFPQDHIFAW